MSDETDMHSDQQTAFRFVRDAANATEYRGKLFSFVVHGRHPHMLRSLLGTHAGLH